MGKRVPTLKVGKPTKILGRKESKKFYQSMDWRTFRKKHKRKTRKKHEQIVVDAYLSNKNNSPEDLLKFLTSDNPLCEYNLSKGIIKVANVLDHKKPIRTGGSRFKDSNLQWVTESYHNSKSGKEAHE